MHGIPVIEKEINLNIFRMILCLVLAYLICQDAAGYDKLYETARLHDTYFSFDFLQIGQLSLSLVHVIRTVLVATLVLSAFGVYTRVSLVLASVFYFLYIGNQLGFTKSPFSEYASHNKTIALYILVIMTFAPEIRRFSLDGLRRNGWKGWSTQGIAGGIAGIDAIQWMLALAYLGSALSKLMYNWEWADGYTLQSYLLRKHLLYDTYLGGILMQNIELCKWLSLLTLLFEGTFFLCLVFRKLKPVYILSGILFHSGIYLTMHINFGAYFFVNYLSFLNYSRFPGLRGILNASEVPAGTLLERLRRPSIGFIQQCIVIVILGAQGLSIAFEYESWPFTNYGVFVQRQIPSEITEYRFACCCENANEYEWIPRARLPRSETTLSRMMRFAKLKDSIEEESKIIESVKSILMLSPTHCDELMLMKGQGVFDTHGKLVAHFEMIYQEFLEDMSQALRE